MVLSVKAAIIITIKDTLRVKTYINYNVKMWCGRKGSRSILMWKEIITNVLHLVASVIFKPLCSITFVPESKVATPSSQSQESSRLVTLQFIQLRFKCI